MIALLAAGILAAALSPASATPPGTTGVEFLEIPVGARPAGMSEAFTGLADDVHALSYNPAGLALLRQQEMGFVHDAYASGVYHEWAGYVYPSALGTFGASANMLFVKPFDAYDANDQVVGQASAMDSAYQLTYALPFSDTLAFGGSFKRISSRLWNTTAETYAVDGGVLWQPLPRLRVGGAVLNLGPGLRYVAVTESLPTMVRVGASWTPFSPDEYRHWITLACDVTKPRESVLAAAGGAEFWYENILALRVGGRTDAGAGPGYTIGAGIYVFRGEHKGFELGFDYAFTNSGDFATTQRASMVVKFGEPLYERDRLDIFGRRHARYRAAAHEDALRQAPALAPALAPSSAPQSSDLILPEDGVKP